LNMIERQPGQNDVGLPAVLRHAGENTVAAGFIARMRATTMLDDDT
jgi:hypothetical protein